MDANCSGTAALALCAGTGGCRVMIPPSCRWSGVVGGGHMAPPPKAALLASQQQMTPHDVLCATKPQSSASLSAVAQGEYGRCGPSGDTVWPSLAHAVSAVALPSSLQGPFLPCPARSSSPPCPRLLLLILSLSPAHLFPLQGASRAWWMVVSRTWPQESGNERVPESQRVAKRGPYWLERGSAGQVSGMATLLQRPLCWSYSFLPHTSNGSHAVGLHSSPLPINLTLLADPGPRLNCPALPCPATPCVGSDAGPGIDGAPEGPAVQESRSPGVRTAQGALSKLLLI